MGGAGADDGPEGCGTAPGGPADHPADLPAAVLAALLSSRGTALLVCDPGDDGDDPRVLTGNDAARDRLGPLAGRRLAEVLPGPAAGVRALRTGALAGGAHAALPPPSPGQPPLEVEATAAGGLLVLLLHEAAGPGTEEQRLRAVVEHAADAVHVLDAQGRTTWVSPAFERVTGHRAADALGAHYRRFVLPEHHREADAAFAAVLAAPGTDRTARLRVRTATEEPRWIDVRLANHLGEPGVDGVLAAWHDVTDQHVLEHQLAHEALHDPLTGLPNRRFLDELLDRALARLRRGHRTAALVFCDVDHFKVVNDSLGHDAGDALLLDVAARLRAALRPGDVVARFGGDEFVVLCEDLDSPGGAFTVAERLQAALHADYVLDGRAAAVTTSMGLTLLRPGSSAADALSEADSALYEAKAAGRARVEAFTPRMRSQWRHRLDTEAGLRRALRDDELRLHYQPVVDLRDGRISHVEALLRWQPPGREVVAPGGFLPVAEETSLIVDIGAWVLATGAAQAARWQAELADAPRVTLNVAGRQLHDPGFARTVEDVLETSGAAADGLELEVSERLLAADQPRLARTLHRLRERGLHVALDDFGAGQTAIAWLQQLPFDTLKLDRSLVTGLPGAAASAVVQALAQLSQRLDITSIAEGVETPEQLAAVADLGCAHAQGYLLCRPAPAEDLAPLLAAGRLPGGAGAPAQGSGASWG